MGGVKTQREKKRQTHTQTETETERGGCQADMAGVWSLVMALGVCGG